MELYLDNFLIFRGEIARANGGLEGEEREEVKTLDVYINTHTHAHTCAYTHKTILFTMDEDILYQVSQHDDYFQQTVSACSDDDRLDPNHEVQRPKTADIADPQLDLDHRPFTSASLNHTTTTEAQPTGPPAHHIVGRVVQLSLSSTWGDNSSIGLTGIEFVHGTSRQPVALREDQIALFFGENLVEDSTLHKLLDGMNVTTELDHMWSTPLLHSSHQHSLTLTLTLDMPTPILGLRVWNCNASLEDSYKGVCTCISLMHVHVFCIICLVRKL